MKKRSIWRMVYEWNPVGPGKLMDWSTYRGCFRALGFWIVMTYFMWHTHDLLAWCRWVFDIPYEIDHGKQSWARVWAVIIGGSGVLTSIAAMISLPIAHRRARKSAIGQWYDRTDLTPEDLYGPSAGMVGQDDESEAPDSTSRRFQRK